MWLIDLYLPLIIGICFILYILYYICAAADRIKFTDLSFSHNIFSVCECSTVDLYIYIYIYLSVESRVFEPLLNIFFPLFFTTFFAFSFDKGLVLDRKAKGENDLLLLFLSNLIFVLDQTDVTILWLYIHKTIWCLSKIYRGERTYTMYMERGCLYYLKSVLFCFFF